MLTDEEVLYGGAAGGGKSDWLLQAAALFAEVPGYTALLLRRTYPELALEGSIMDRAEKWWGGTSAHWSAEKKRWTFLPSGATITFGYLQSEGDKYRYKSTQFHFIGFDELTGFTQSQYRYLFSRLRREKGSKIPPRMRSGSNPGDLGHEWVKQRFMADPYYEDPIDGTTKKRIFIPAKIADNPYLDAVAYRRSLAQLDPYTRAQLEEGNWDVLPGGNKFKRSWFEVVQQAPMGIQWIRFWDLASTEPKKGKDPDYTAGALLGEKDGVYYVKNVVRDRLSPGGVEDLIKQTARLDGKLVQIGMEQEPGASGKTVSHHYSNRVLKGYDFRAVPSWVNKEMRANPVSSAAEAGNVKLVSGEWDITAFLDEICQFPEGPHDDQVDAVSGAFDLVNKESVLEEGYIL